MGFNSTFKGLILQQILTTTYWSCHWYGLCFLWGRTWNIMYKMSWRRVLKVSKG